MSDHMKAGKIISDVLSLYAPKMTIVEAGGETSPVREFTYEQTLGMLWDLHNRIDSMRHVPEVGDNANISDVLCAAFGQYFDAGGIIELDIQDDDQVRPLIAYMAQGVADYFLRDGNKYANLIYRMGETAGALNPAPPTSGPLRQAPDGLLDRVKAAEERINADQCIRRIPADPTDPDLVMCEVRMWLECRGSPLWIKGNERKFSGVGELERSGYIPEGSAAEREANPAPPTSSQGNVPPESLTSDAVKESEPTPAQAGAELPELPEPAGVLVINGQALRGFTADQMREMYRRAYAELARRGGSDG